jgi:hypothetical protein
VIEVKQPMFKLGQVVATPGALDALRQAGQVPFEFVARHAQGDWGDLSEEDRRLNDESVKDGSRILSAYRLKTGVKLWIITEAEDDQRHRAATTLLLPDEY